MIVSITAQMGVAMIVMVAVMELAKLHVRVYAIRLVKVCVRVVVWGHVIRHVEIIVNSVVTWDVVAGVNMLAYRVKCLL